MEKIYLGLGSNQGDRVGCLQSGIARLSSLLNNIRGASFYETEPRDFFNQPAFINTVLQADLPEFSPQEMLRHIHTIETAHHRMRDESRPKGPRTLDIDILIWGSETIDEKGLSIPHPAMKERAFVLIPLLELESELLDSVTGEPFRAYKKKVEDQGVYFYRSFSL